MNNWSDSKKFWYETRRKSFFGFVGIITAVGITWFVDQKLSNERLWYSANLAQQTDIIGDYFQISRNIQHLALEYHSNDITAYKAEQPRPDNRFYFRRHDELWSELQRLHDLAEVYFDATVIEKMNDYEMQLSFLDQRVVNLSPIGTNQNISIEVYENRLIGITSHKKVFEQNNAVEDAKIELVAAIQSDMAHQRMR